MYEIGRFVAPVIIDPVTLRPFPEPFVAYLYQNHKCVAALTETEVQRYTRKGTKVWNVPKLERYGDDRDAAIAVLGGTDE